MEGQPLSVKGVKVRRVAQEHPTDVQRVRGETVAIFKVSRQAVFLGLQSFLFVDRGDGFVLFQDGRPSVLPTYRQEVSVPPRIVEVVFVRAAGQEYGIPVALRCGHEVGVPGTGHDVRPLRIQSRALRQDGVAFGELFPRAFRFLRAEDDFGMPCARPSFGAHQVIIFADAVQVGTLYPDRVLLHMAARTYDFDLVAHHAVAFHVEVVEHDAAFALVDVTAYRLIVIHDVSASVLVEKERRVDRPPIFGQVDGFAPAFWPGLSSLRRNFRLPRWS